MQEIDGLAAADEVVLGRDGSWAGIEPWRGREACANAPPHHMHHPAARLTLKLPNVSGERFALAWAVRHVAIGGSLHA